VLPRAGMCQIARLFILTNRSFACSRGARAEAFDQLGASDITTGSKLDQLLLRHCELLAKMPRPRFQREPCDCIDCNDLLRVPRAADQDVRHSAALQDPPPKCLIVYADGILLPAPPSGGGAAAGISLDHAVCPHLDGVARDGCCGMLAVQSPSAGAAQRAY
jgi:hypothetical protein